MGRPPRIRRDQILDTARRVFAAKGFAAATLADIAGELGVTPAALLRHVGSKDALFAEAMRSGAAIEIPAAVRDLAATPAEADPRAAALLFMGSLQGYVLFHHVLKMPPVCTLSEYIDTLIDLWCEGAIIDVGGSRGRQSKNAAATRGAAGGARRRRRRAGDLLRASAQTAGARPLRHAGGADGQRRLARRRPRGKSPRR